MVVNVSNRNGRDDDNLPPTQGICSPGGVKKGRLSEQGIPSSSFNVDELICELERNAYHALLIAFTAQSKFLTWAKEGLMSSLRKELRIADDQHRQMLGTIENDETLARVLTWRRTEKDPNMPPLPPIYQSRKKQKISHDSPRAPLLKRTPRHSIVTSTSNGRGLPTQKPYLNKGIANALKFNEVSKGTPRPNNVGKGGQRVGDGRRRPPPQSHLKSASPSANESWVGRSVRIRWSEDNILYKALIVGYDKEVMLHRIAYDSGTPDETFEWIDLTKMGEDDIQWLDNTIDPISLDGKGHPLGFLAEQRKGGFKLPVGKSKGRDEGQKPSDNFLQAPMPQSRLGRGEPLAKVNNNGTQVKYPEVASFVKEINALEHENDLEKLENGKRITKEYEEMLQKALAMVTNFSIDGESKEEDDSSEDSDSSGDDDSSDDGDSSGDDDDDSSDDSDNSGDEGLEVSYGNASATKLDHVEDNGDNDDYIEID